MIIWLFIISDILASIALGTGWGFLAFIGWVMIAKGTYTLFYAFSSKNYFQIFGYLDVAIGIIILSPWNLEYIWIIPLAKALLSLF